MKNKYLSLFALIFAIGIIFYYLRFAISPFAISIIIAYLTMPIVNFAEKYKIPRGISAILIVLMILCCCFYAFALLIPFLIDKGTSFFEMFDKKLLSSDNVHKFLLQHFSMFDEQKITSFENTITDLLKNFIHTDLNYIFNKIKASGSVAVNVIIVLMPCPVITFFMLRDWEKMIVKIQNAIPRRYIKEFVNITTDMSESLSSYIRGQMQVCLILSVLYSIPLYIIGLNFGIPIGILTGILAFIPYIGVIISAIVTVTVATMQFNDIQHVLMVLGVLMAGQAIDGSMITPRIIGQKVNIHPTWIILGLFISVVVFGVIGAIFALPLIACGSVIIKFIANKYQHSRYYMIEKTDNDD